MRHYSFYFTPRTINYLEYLLPKFLTVISFAHAIAYAACEILVPLINETMG